MKNKIVLFTYGNVFLLQENWMRLLSVFPTKLQGEEMFYGNIPGEELKDEDIYS